MINTHQEGSEQFPTLFGFKTDNKIAANGLNAVYGVVMIVAMAFAYHALSLILVDWNAGLIFLAALAVVGLPYCIKIIMYGRKTFHMNMAILCIAISLLPTIFDFIGFYSETSIRQKLLNTKFEVLEKVNFFDKEAREAINNNIIQLDKEYNGLVTKIEQDFNSKKTLLNKEVVDAEQTFLDETDGISGKTTSGKPGVGPKAKELESEVRKTGARIALAKKEFEENKSKELLRVEKDYQTKLKSYQEGIDAINELLKNDNKNGLIFEVNHAKSYNELADVLVRLNSSVNTISSKLGVQPEYVKFSTENVIQLSFGALLNGEITALICFALALLLEVVDTVIVYMVRGNNKSNKIEEVEQPESKLRERIYYDWGGSKNELIKTPTETISVPVDDNGYKWIYDNKS
jgi:hypothetical protein